MQPVVVRGGHLHQRWLKARGSWTSWDQPSASSNKVENAARDRPQEAPGDGRELPGTCACILAALAASLRFSLRIKTVNAACDKLPSRISFTDYQLTDF